MCLLNNYEIIWWMVCVCVYVLAHIYANTLRSKINLRCQYSRNLVYWDQTQIRKDLMSEITLSLSSQCKDDKHMS